MKHFVFYRFVSQLDPEKKGPWVWDAAYPDLEQAASQVSKFKAAWGDRVEIVTIVALRLIKAHDKLVR